LLGNKAVSTEALLKHLKEHCKCIFHKILKSFRAIYNTLETCNCNYILYQKCYLACTKPGMLKDEIALKEWVVGILLFL